MPVDPRLNCAAEICCGEPPPIASGVAASVQGTSGDAHRARVSILCDLGMDREQASKASKLMTEMGIVFLSADLARAIRDVAFGASARETTQIQVSPPLRSEL